MCFERQLNIKDMTIDFRGIELDVEYDVYEPDERVGLSTRIDIVSVFYKGCDVTEIMLAMEKVDDAISELEDLVYERIR